MDDHLTPAAGGLAVDDGRGSGRGVEEGVLGAVGAMGALQAHETSGHVNARHRLPQDVVDHVPTHLLRRLHLDPSELILTAAATTIGRGEVDLGAVVVETMTDVGLTGTHVVDATGDPRALDAHPQLTGVEIGFDREGASVLTEL